MADVGSCSQGCVHEVVHYGQELGLVEPYASVILKRRSRRSIYEVWFREKPNSAGSIFIPKNRRAGPRSIVLYFSFSFSLISPKFSRKLKNICRSST